MQGSILFIRSTPQLCCVVRRCSLTVFIPSTIARYSSSRLSNIPTLHHSRNPAQPGRQRRWIPQNHPKVRIHHDRCRYPRSPPLYHLSRRIQALRPIANIRLLTSLDTKGSTSISTSRFSHFLPSALFTNRHTRVHSRVRVSAWGHLSRRLVDMDRSVVREK